MDNKKQQNLHKRYTLNDRERNGFINHNEPFESIAEQVAFESGISIEQAKLASESLLKTLHKRLVEYRGLNGSYLGESAHWELSEVGYFHFLGIIEQISTKYSWEPGSIVEYLGRLPPVERWKSFAKDMQDWNQGPA